MGSWGEPRGPIQTDEETLTLRAAVRQHLLPEVNDATTDIEIDVWVRDFKLQVPRLVASKITYRHQGPRGRRV